MIRVKYTINQVTMKLTRYLMAKVQFNIYNSSGDDPKCVKY